MSYLARLKQLESEKKSHYDPRTELPKVPKPPFGTFGTTPGPRIEKKNDDLKAADTAPWDAADWQGYSHERAGVAEFDGGLSRHEAEGQAFECCIAEWMCQHPVTSEPGQCAWCGRGGTDRLPLLPYGDATHGHTHLHGECWPAWYAHRRQAAIAALAGYEIVRETTLRPLPEPKTCCAGARGQA